LNPRSRTIWSLTFSGRVRGFPWVVYGGGRRSSDQAVAGRSSARALRLGLASMPNRKVRPSASQASSCLVWVKSVSLRREMRRKPAWRQRRIARSSCSAAPSCEGRLPGRLTMLRTSPVLARETISG
jgi:hypothetical protein